MSTSLHQDAKKYKCDRGCLHLILLKMKTKIPSYLTSAYCACQLMPCDIRFPGKCATSSFNKIKQSAVKVCVSSSRVIRIFIDASIHRTIVIVIFSHQVPFVLACPSRGTHITTWYHDLCSTFGHMTHGTCDIVVVQTAGIYASRECFIFSAKDSCTIVLITRLIFCINRITCQAHVVRSTAFVCIMRSTYITYK